jgi:hypothetical protein
MQPMAASQDHLIVKQGDPFRCEQTASDPLSLASSGVPEHAPTSCWPAQGQGPRVPQLEIEDGNILIFLGDLPGRVVLTGNLS